MTLGGSDSISTELFLPVPSVHASCYLLLCSKRNKVERKVEFVSTQHLFSLYGVWPCNHINFTVFSCQLCIKGRHVFMGYLNNEEKTKESLDELGWLHTGDIGKIDKVGFHRACVYIKLPTWKFNNVEEWLRPSNTGNIFFQLVAQQCCNCKLQLFVARFTTSALNKFSCCRK